MGILDIIFPKSCVVCKKSGSYLCANCFTYLSFDAKSLCLLCNKPTFNGLTHPKCVNKYAIDGCFSALTYNRTAQKLIYNFKYKPFLTDIKMVLTDLFFESLIQNENFNNELKRKDWIFVPIPLSGEKLKKRGYNQAEILAKELSKKLKPPYENLLKRVKDTKTQVGLSNIKRKENIKGAFVINPESSSMSKNVLLVDDIVTTGSTLKEAANVIKRGGAKRVIGLTLSRD